MSEELNRRIRELFEAAERAAPETPPSPNLSHERILPVRWRRWVLIPAASMIVVMLGVAVVFDVLGIEFGLGFAGSADESGVVSPGDGELAIVLADLNLACSELAEEFSGLETPLEDDGAAFDRLLLIQAWSDDLGDQLDSAVSGSLGGAHLGRVREEIGVLADALVVALDSGVTGALDRYGTVAESLYQLGEALAGAGALECAALP